MHSDTTNIQQQFHIALDRLQSSGVDKDKISEVSYLLHDYLGECFSALLPSYIIQSKLINIYLKLKELDNVSNHGYLYLAFEYMKNQKKKEGKDSVIARTSEDLLSDRLGKTKLREDHKEEKVPTLQEIFDQLKEDGSLIDLVESYQRIIPKNTIKQASVAREARAVTTTFLSEEISTRARSNNLAFLEEDIKELIAANKELVERLIVKFAKHLVLNEVFLSRDVEKNQTFGHYNLYHNGIENVKKNGYNHYIAHNAPIHDLGKVGDLGLKMFEGIDKNSGFLVSHDDSGNIHHVLHLKHPEGFHKDTLVTHVSTKNPDINSHVKMHEIYDHLLDKGFVLMSDKEQSEGGLNVWKNLSRIPGVNVHAYDIKNDKSINSDRFLRSTDDTHASYDWHKDPEEKESRRNILHDVRLVASKKDLSEEFLRSEFLIEAQMMDKYPKNEKFGDDIFYGRNTVHDVKDYLESAHGPEKSLGKIGHHINVSQFEGQSYRKPAGKIITHDANGVIHHVLSYERPYHASPETMRVIKLTSNDKAHKAIGAHDLYHHLLDHGNIMESDIDHTQAGLNVWKNLSRMPGVNVHGWDNKEDKPVNTDRYLRSTDDTHTTKDEIRNPLDPKTKADKEHIRDYVRLVAHK
jgi:hypothetical protein